MFDRKTLPLLALIALLQAPESATPQTSPPGRQGPGFPVSSGTEDCRYGRETRQAARRPRALE